MNMSNNILNNSKLSIGLYQGPDNDEVDQYLFDVIEHAIKIGINNFDVAPNYRNTRSELVLGRILKKSKSENIFITTKGGFVPFDFSDATINESDYIHTNYINTSLATKNTFDFYHFQSFDPRYLEHEFNLSLQRLNVDKIDLYYLHNPEYLLARVDKETFLKQMNSVYIWLKQKIDNKQILNFGISTWDGFFYEDANKRLQMIDFIDFAVKHNIMDHFKAIQFPFNILKTDAFSKATQFIDNGFISLIRAAIKYNISCITSAPFGQGQIKNIHFPSQISDNFYGSNNFQKALSFCLSAPYIQTVIFGTLKLTHLDQAIEVLNHNGHSIDSFYKVFKS